MTSRERFNDIRWRLFCEALDAGAISVICENHPARTPTSEGGLIVTELDEVMEHLFRYARTETTENVTRSELQTLASVMED
jgi:hypothetical protein